VAQFGEADVERLLQDAGIVRHRGKIEAVINNAQRAIEMVAKARWPRSSGATSRLCRRPGRWCRHRRPESQTLSKELKKRGWKFVGPTTVYA
jgi:DNA-3-methyladenine glycosylase I